MRLYLRRFVLLFQCKLFVLYSHRSSSESHECQLQKLCNHFLYPEITCTADVKAESKSCHTETKGFDPSEMTSEYRQCTREVNFDCKNTEEYHRVHITREYDDPQFPVFSLNDTNALSGFTASTLVLRNLGINWIKPRVFLNLSKTLTELDLSFNKIKQLSRCSFFQASKLRIVYLAYNELNEVPWRAIYSLRRLVKLYLKGNVIERIEKKNFKTQKFLGHVDLSENRIKSIESGSFKNLKSLNTLQLAENRLVSLPQLAFDGLDNLNELDLSVNSLTAVPVKSLRILPSLSKLYLTGNKIVCVPDSAFEHNRNLTVLDLSYNGLVQISPVFMRGIFGLEELYIHGNKFHCDCSLAWMRCFQHCLCVLQTDNCTTPDKLTPYTIIDYPMEEQCLETMQDIKCSDNVTCHFVPESTTPRMQYYTESEFAIYGSDSENFDKIGIFLDEPLITWPPNFVMTEIPSYDNHVEMVDHFEDYNDDECNENDDYPRKGEGDQPVDKAKSHGSHGHLLKTIGPPVTGCFIFIVFIFLAFNRCRKYFARRNHGNELFGEASQAIYSSSADTAETMVNE